MVLIETLLHSLLPRTTASLTLKPLGFRHLSFWQKLVPLFEIRRDFLECGAIVLEVIIPVLAYGLCHRSCYCKKFQRNFSSRRKSLSPVEVFLGGEKLRACYCMKKKKNTFFFLQDGLFVLIKSDLGVEQLSASFPWQVSTLFLCTLLFPFLISVYCTVIRNRFCRKGYSQIL